MFAFACLLFALAGPFGAWAALQMSSGPGTFQSERYGAGEEFRVSEAGRSVAVWALPEDVDREAVTCTRNDTPVPLTSETATELDGESAALLLEGGYTAIDRLSCDGGGLQEIAVSTRFPPDRARTVTVAALVATPFVVGLGLLLRRRGYRWPS